MQDQGRATYLERAWISDKVQGLKRGKPNQRGVGRGMQRSKSGLKGHGTSSGVLKNDGKVRRLSKSMNGSDRKLVFEL